MNARENQLSFVAVKIYPDQRLATARYGQACGPWLSRGPGFSSSDGGLKRGKKEKNPAPRTFPAWGPA